MTESDPVVILDEDAQAFRENNQLNPTSYNARNYAEEERTYVHKTPWGELELDAMRQTAVTPLPERHMVKLRRKEALILERLLKFPLTVHSPESLGSIGSKQQFFQQEDSVHNARINIAHIRRRLGHTPETPIIHTVWGNGYTLILNKEHYLADISGQQAAN